MDFKVSIYFAFESSIFEIKVWILLKFDNALQKKTEKIPGPCVDENLFQNINLNSNCKTKVPDLRCKIFNTKRVLG